MNSILLLLWSNKKTVLTVAITLFLSYAVFMLFKKVDVANQNADLSNKQRRQLQGNFNKLAKEKDSIAFENAILLEKIRKDSIAVSKIKKTIAAKEILVYRQRTNIKTIKDKYEAVYRLDSVSDDELLRLFSEHNIETNSNKK